MTDEEIVDRLKDLFSDVVLEGKSVVAVKLTYRTSSDSWRGIAVSDPSILDVAPDGYMVVIEDSEL
jgi:hypothetical protein